MAHSYSALYIGAIAVRVGARADIFDPFVQLPQGAQDLHGGLGVGLTLVKTLTDLHGGTVEAISAGPGRGSEFIVRLPGLEAPGDAASSPARASPAGREAAAASQAPVAPPNTFLRKQTLTRELKTIQRKESAPDRTLSKIIHQPAIRAVSEATSKTLSRPSGLLGGGILAFAGTGGYLYLAKHIGFSYQSSVFLVLLVAGFGLGLALEALLRLFTSRRS